MDQTTSKRQEKLSSEDELALPDVTEKQLQKAVVDKNKEILAERFIAEARKIQRDSGKTFYGRTDITTEELGDIKQAVANLDLVRKEDGELKEAVLSLNARFEELCRRRGIDFPHSLKAAVYELLARQLVINHKALGGALKRLVAVTILTGTVSDLPKDPKFKIWAGKPYIFRLVAYKHPDDPREFLRYANEQFAKMCANPELKKWRFTEGAIRRAVIYGGRSPYGYLRRVSGIKIRLPSDPELKEQFSKQETVKIDPKAIQDAASSYLAELRELQRNSIADLRGPVRVSYEDCHEIAFAVASSDVCRLLKRDIAESLSHKLEEMARRRKMPLQETIRSSVYDMIAKEFKANVAAFGGDEKTLIAATIYNGDVSGLHSVPEFERFFKTRGMIANAVRNSPRDPAAFLRKAAKEIDRLKADPRFTRFLKNEGIFNAAVIGYPDNPDKYLLETEAIIKRHEADPRFAELRKSAGDFLYVAVRYGKSSELFLEEVIEGIHRFKSDKRFARFKDAPWVFKRVMFSSPQNPAKALQNVSDTIDRLAMDKRFTEFASAQGLLLNVALKYPTDPEGFLLKTKKIVAKLKADPRFYHFKTFESAFLYAATRYGLKAEKFLVRAVELINRYSADPRLKAVHKYKSIFRRAVLYFQNDCEDLLLKAVNDRDTRERLLGCANDFEE